MQIAKWRRYYLLICLDNSEGMTSNDTEYVVNTTKTKF